MNVDNSEVSFQVQTNDTISSFEGKLESEFSTNNCNESKETKDCSLKIMKKKKVIVIGIGGISRSGKSTLRKYLVERINPIGVFHVDDYLISPIKKWDEKIQEYIEDWEDPVAHDLDKMHLEMKALKESAMSNSDKNDIEVKFIIAEGFLLYNRKDISDLIDVKFSYVIEKELCRERRKNTKFYGSDYYFDEYIWKYFHLNK